MKKKVLPYIIALSALAVSASAAFYSVSGLSKLFAGASTEVIIMAGSLEVAKLVIASLLYQYWGKINKVLRTYLAIATLILVMITSLGIYGFLSSAYQETHTKVEMVETQQAFLQQKEDFFAQDVARYDVELGRISDTIAKLSEAKATSIQVRDESSSTGYRNTVSTAELKLAQERITAEEKTREKVQASRSSAADSVQKYQLQILDIESSSELAGELGPLKYLSALTGVSMDRIINYLLLIIIFVFDPLAISLVIAANFAFDQARKPQPLAPNRGWEEYQEEVAKGLPDALLIQDLPEEKSEEVEEVTDFKESAPPQGTKVVRIVQKTPSHYNVITETGERVKISKTDYDESSKSIVYR